MCHCKIMKQNISERPLSEFIYLHFHFIAIALKFIYIISKISYFWLYSQKYTIVSTDMHFSFQYMIIKTCLTHAHSVYAVLTGIWCIEMTRDRRS
jgi:hypothetical protein